MFKATIMTNFFRSAVVLTAIAGVCMGAQTTAPASTSAVVNAQFPSVNTSSDSLFSSSTAETAGLTANLNPTVPNFAEMMQYGGRPRGRGGRPRYRGANTNPDGSNKWTGLAGFGFVQTAGNTWHYYTPSWGMQVGFGRQWSKKFALPIQFDYDHFGLTGQTLANQESLYTTAAIQYNDANPDCSTSEYGCDIPPNPLDGNMHIWSFSLNPTETFLSKDTWGAYAVEGVGFYHKVTNFTTPEIYEDYIGEEYEANSIIDHYTSNAPGFSAGLGITYKFSHFSGERFYAEARYVYILNSQRQGMTSATIGANASNWEIANDFPANSNRTSYFPVKFGIRF